MTVQAQQNTENVAEFFQGINNHLPILPEPQRGALFYGVLISKHPGLDKAFCLQAGKVVHITAQLSEQITSPVTMRGSELPLCWEMDHAANEPATPSFFERTFTFHVPPERMNQMLEFKLCIPPAKATDKLRWSSGNNWSVDLSKYGHIVAVDVIDVSFS